MGLSALQPARGGYDYRRRGRDYRRDCRRRGRDASGPRSPRFVVQTGSKTKTLRIPERSRYVSWAGHIATSFGMLRAISSSAAIREM